MSIESSRPLAVAMSLVWTRTMLPVNWVSTVLPTISELEVELPSEMASPALLLVWLAMTDTPMVMDVDMVDTVTEDMVAMGDMVATLVDMATMVDMEVMDTVMATLASTKVSYYNLLWN